MSTGIEHDADVFLGSNQSALTLAEQYQIASTYSIAISLKRIADMIDAAQYAIYQAAKESQK